MIISWLYLCHLYLHDIGTHQVYLLSVHLSELFLTNIYSIAGKLQRDLFFLSDEFFKLFIPLNSFKIKMFKKNKATCTKICCQLLPVFQSIGLDFAWERELSIFSAEYNWIEIIAITTCLFQSLFNTKETISFRIHF